MTDLSRNYTKEAIWFQEDAEFLYRAARTAFDNSATHSAKLAQENAAISAQIARDFAHLAAQVTA